MVGGRGLLVSGQGSALEAILPLMEGLSYGVHCGLGSLPRRSPGALEPGSSGKWQATGLSHTGAGQEAAWTQLGCLTMTVFFCALLFLFIYLFIFRTPRWP